MTRPEDKTVLVVDDEEDIRDYLAAVLEDAGFRVITAADGNQAIERLREAPVDFVSLDLVMPNKSGMRFLREMRQNPAWASIPFVVVTAHAHDEQGKDDLQRILAERSSGPGLCLEKPIQPEQYVETVCARLGVEAPARQAGDASLESLRREVAGLLQRADHAQLMEIARILKK